MIARPRIEWIARIRKAEKMIRIPEIEAQRNFPRTVTQVAENHELVMIQRDGKDIVAIIPIEALPMDTATAAPSGGAKKPLWQRIVDLGASIPDEAWAKVPEDLSINIDHYLYGSPKAEE